MPFYYRHYEKEAPNSFVRNYRKIYRPTGFKRGYNFPLWIILAGAALGFCASRAEYLDFRGTYARAKTVTGDWYYQQGGHYYIGIAMHLSAIVPIGFLVPWQFLPIVRHKLIIFHRINGYLLSILLLIGNAGAFMIARHGLGGSLGVQTMVGILGISTTVSLILAIWNIKVLQIDQHRAWMLRTWVYAFTIITQRIVQAIAFQIISQIGGYYLPVGCEVIASISNTLGIPNGTASYPECGIDPHATVAVKADFFSKVAPESIGAAVDIVFSLSMIVAFFIHAVGTEIYLHLTPAEAARLRQYSYERQLERGWKNPGCRGTSAQRWGDALPFQPTPNEQDDDEPRHKLSDLEQSSSSNEEIDKTPRA